MKVTRLLSYTGVILLTVAPELGAAAVFANDPPVLPPGSSVTRPASASDIAALPGVYVGKPVLLRSEVYRVYDQHAFLVSDEPLLAAPEVLVLVPQPVGKAADRYMLVISGTGRRLEPRDLEREFDWFRPALFGGARVLEQWRKSQMPVVIADSIRTENGLELVATGTAQTEAVGTAPSVLSGRAQGNESRPVDDLAVIFRSGDPLELAGNPIALRAVSVGRVFTPKLVAVGTDPQHQMLVELPTPHPELAPGQAVDVLGILRPTPASLAHWGLRPDQAQLAPIHPIYIAADKVEITPR